jgi:hypothetical protein
MAARIIPFPFHSEGVIKHQDKFKKPPARLLTFPASYDLLRFNNGARPACDGKVRP